MLSMYLNGFLLCDQSRSHFITYITMLILNTAGTKYVGRSYYPHIADGMGRVGYKIEKQSWIYLIQVYKMTNSLRYMYLFPAGKGLSKAAWNQQKRAILNKTWLTRQFFLLFLYSPSQFHCWLLRSKLLEGTQDGIWTLIWSDFFWQPWRWTIALSYNGNTRLWDTLGAKSYKLWCMQ